MKFSTFLKILIRNKVDSIKTKEDFVIGFFESTGVKFNYSSDYAKKLANDGPAGKPLTDDIRECFNVPFKLCIVAKWLKNSLEKNRLLDLLDAFDISKDEKKDFSIFTEALAAQFTNYINYGEDKIPTKVKDIYIMLLDQYGNGSDPKANEKAVLAAKHELYSAVQSIASINIVKDVADLKGPFESFFIGIYNTFKAFESKCNRQGLEDFREVRKFILDEKIDSCPDNDTLNRYIMLASEPSSIPLELVKQIKFIIYDNYTFADKVTEVSLRLTDDYEYQKKLDALKNVKFYPTNEMFFTEIIKFNLEGENKNLLDYILFIIMKTDMIIYNLANEYCDVELTKPIDKKIFNEVDKYLRNQITFLTDGTYYPLENKIEYAMTVENLVGMEDGSTKRAGDDKISKNRLFWMEKSSSFEEAFKLYVLWTSYQWTELGKCGDRMNELLTFNEDGTCRFYMFVPTCKAKCYRMIREIASRCINDGTVSFIGSMNTIVNFYDEKEIVNSTSIERQETGINCLTFYGYEFNKPYCMHLTKDDIENKNYKLQRPEGFPHIFNPIVEKIIFNYGVKKYNEDKEKDSSKD